MKLSHSRIDTYVKCPYKYNLRYVQKLSTLDDFKADDPLKIGTMLHTAIERGMEAAKQEYFNSYPIIGDEHITEVMKIEALLPKAKELLPPGEHELKIECDDFIGFIDLLVNVNLPYDDEFPNDNKYEYYDLYDFKYSNNISNYMESGQLHEYKYFFEKLNPGKKIRKLYFVFIPKSQLRIKYKNKTNPKDETIYEFRQRVMEDLKTKTIQVVEVQYQPEKVIEYLINSKHAIEDTEFKKNETRLCDWCEFKKYCLEGIDYEIVKRGR